MAPDPGLELVEVTIERVIGFRESSAAAVVLAHPTKKFLIFVGPAEGMAVQRELSHEKADRPATHDLLDYVMKGFDIDVKKVVVSAIMNNVFCATVILTQSGRGGAPSEEVRLDARASDSIVIALKAKVPLWVTKRVLDAVDDAGPHLLAAEEKPGEASGLESEEEDEEGEDEREDKPDFGFDPGDDDDEGDTPPN